MLSSIFIMYSLPSYAGIGNEGNSQIDNAHDNITATDIERLGPGGDLNQDRPRTRAGEIYQGILDFFDQDDNEDVPDNNAPSDPPPPPPGWLEPYEPNTLPSDLNNNGIPDDQE